MRIIPEEKLAGIVKKKKKKQVSFITFPSTSFFLRCLQKKEKEEIDRNPMTGGLTFLYYYYFFKFQFTDQSNQLRIFTGKVMKQRH